MPSLLSSICPYTHTHTYTHTHGMSCVIQSQLLNERGRRRACGLRCSTTNLMGSNKLTVSLPERGPLCCPWLLRKYMSAGNKRLDCGSTKGTHMWYFRHSNCEVFVGGFVVYFPSFPSICLRFLWGFSQQGV